MKRGVVLLLSALLVWTPAGAVKADATTCAADVNAQIKIQENKVPEDAAQTNEAQAIHQQAAEGGKRAGVNACVWKDVCGSRS